MTSRELIQVLYEHVTFPSGISSKRFVRDMAETATDYVLSERAERFAWRIAYVYRRQLPKAIAEEAAARKVNHQWELDGEILRRCAVCRTVQYSRRVINSACPGPPATKTPKRKECIGTRGAVADTESPIVAPQPSMFDDGAPW